MSHAGASIALSAAHLRRIACLFRSSAGVAPLCRDTRLQSESAKHTLRRAPQNLSPTHLNAPFTADATLPAAALTAAAARRAPALIALPIFLKTSKNPSSSPRPLSTCLRALATTLRAATLLALTLFAASTLALCKRRIPRSISDGCCVRIPRIKSLRPSLYAL